MLPHHLRQAGPKVAPGHLPHVGCADDPALTWEDAGPARVAPTWMQAMGNWRSAYRPHGTCA